MKYKIYFEQINAECVEVKAKTERMAIDKAEKIWKKDNYPTIKSIEEDKEK